MSSDEAGPRLGASGEQIRTRSFATVRRGYDPDQVHDYLASVAAHVDELEHAVVAARTRAVELEAVPPTDPYEQVSRRFANVLATADAEAEQIVDQARGEADRIRFEAQSRAEELRMRSSRSLIAAQEESDRMMSSLAGRREAMLGQLHEMQARLLSVADDLEDAIQPPVPPGVAPAVGPVVAAEPSPVSTPIEEMWVARDPSAPVGAGMERFPVDPDRDDVDLPDLRDLDLDLDLDDDRGGA